jgi:hypothetical protein
MQMSRSLNKQICMLARSSVGGWLEVPTCWSAETGVRTNDIFVLCLEEEYFHLIIEVVFVNNVAP